ncbi:unnamed protein product [Lasius platythorax]|uniref:Uncharacterized protein n=1 Tax=Lasius platythorax TaxID=488582 RepID=A0AAV2P3W7_9HYME
MNPTMTCIHRTERLWMQALRDGRGADEVRGRKGRIKKGLCGGKKRERRRERKRDKVDGGRGKTGAEKTWSNLQQS